MRRRSRGPRSTCASGGGTTFRGRKVREKGHISFPAGCGRRGIPAQGPEEGAHSLCPQSPSGATPLPAVPTEHQDLIFLLCSPNFLGRKAIPVSSQSVKHWIYHHSSQQARTGSSRFWLPNDSSFSERGKNYGYFYMGWVVKPWPGCPSATLGPAVLGIPHGMPLSASTAFQEPWHEVGTRYMLFPDPFFFFPFPSFSVIANPQTVLRINTIEIYPCLS